MSYTLPHAVYTAFDETTKLYTAYQMQAAYQAGRASRDAEVEALKLEAQFLQRAVTRRDERLSLLEESIDKLRLEAEGVEALRADAERYRWLKHNPEWLGWEHDVRPDEVEREIDAARKEK